VSEQPRTKAAVRDNSTAGFIAREILRYEAIVKRTDEACEILHAALGDHGPDDDDTGCGCRMLTIEVLAHRAAKLISELKEARSK